MSGPDSERAATWHDDFLSGSSGEVSGVRAVTSAVCADVLEDARRVASLEALRLRRAASNSPRRRVLILAIERTGVANILPAARRELLRSHHDVTFASTAAGDRGKFENLNGLLEDHPATGHDWLLAVDDDVSLPRGFLDMFVFLAERFDLRLAQPAHRRRSHAGWQVTRRRQRSVVRETRFVEIGPVFAFQAATFHALLPFPPLRTGWGLDAHWSAIAGEHGWRLGVIDATAVGHGLRRVATAYDRQAAIAEARCFLHRRPYIRASDAQTTLCVHRNWR